MAEAELKQHIKQRAQRSRDKLEVNMKPPVSCARSAMQQ
jgi:hypothetical protein